MENLFNHFNSFLAQITRIGGDSRELIFAPPALEEELIDIETQLNYKIPTDFRNCLLTISAHCEFKWFLPDDFKLPNELRQIFCGEIHWGTKFILSFNKDKDYWIKEVFPNIEDKYDSVWHNKFVFQEVGNGDYLGIDLLPDSYGKIIYLSHDDGSGHGFVMANSFSELLSNWTKIGCVGGEDWQWLPFYDATLNKISPDCSNAKLWKEIIGII